MNKTRILSVLVPLSLALSVPSAHAADFSLLGSYWSTDDFDSSAGAGLRLAFFEAVQLELGATYYEEFGENFQFSELGFENVTLDMDAIPVDFGLRFNLGSGPVYLGLGGVYYFLDTANGSVDDELGYYLRLGLQLSRLFLEAGWRDVEATVESFSLGDIDLDADNIGLDLSGAFFNVGFRF